MTVQENPSSFEELPRNHLYRWRSTVVYLQKSCPVTPVFYLFCRHNALSHCLLDHCMFNSRESYSGQSARVKPSADVPSLSRCDPMENRKHTLTFLLRPHESGRKCCNSTWFPVVACYIIAKSGSIQSRNASC